MKKLQVVLMTLCFVMAPAIAEDHEAEAELLTHAEELSVAIEGLDEELHAVKAPANLIEHVHHTEETVFEFVALVANDAPMKTLEGEFEHIRTDVREIREDLKKARYFNSEVIRAKTWRTWVAYRYLGHNYFDFKTGGGSPHDPH